MSDKYEDPFAVQQPDEAQAEVSNSGNYAGTNENGVNMENTTDTKVRVTFKGGGRSDSPWITVDGGSVSEVFEILTSEGQTLQKVMDRVAVAGAYFAEKGLAAAPGDNTPAKASNASTAKPAPSSNDPQCKHGPRVKRSGMKNGSTWSAWMCPTDKGATDKCDPEWIK